jgi:hypothetical protein
MVLGVLTLLPPLEDLFEIEIKEDRKRIKNP